MLSKLKSRFYIIFTLCFLCFGILLALITSGINYRTNYSNIEASNQNLSNIEVVLKKKLIENYIKRYNDLLKSITDSEIFKKYMEEDDLENKNILEQLFYTMANANKDIMQLRFLNTTGSEQIRIDRNRTNKQIAIISKNELQQKGERYYFKESSKLKNGALWYSDVDLNIEHGEIEQPLNPTYRIATPIYIHGTFKGIVIINLIFKNILDQLIQSSSFDIYLIDSGGEVLYSKDDNLNWSKYLENQKSLSELFPEMIRVIVDSDYIPKDFYIHSLGDLFHNGREIRLILVPQDWLVNGQKSESFFKAIY